MKKSISALVACAVLATAMPLLSTPAQAKKPVPRTASARATANHNAKVDAAKAERAQKSAARAAKKKR